LESRKSEGWLCTIQRQNKNNIYKIKLSDLENQNVKYLMSVTQEQWTWHRQLSHVSMRWISKLNQFNLVKDLPNLKFASDSLCEACQKDKFSKTSFKSKIVVSTSRFMELLHIDLFAPVKATSLNGT
jgi:hypothetical protein